MTINRGVVGAWCRRERVVSSFAAHSPLSSVAVTRKGALIETLTFNPSSLLSFPAKCPLFVGRLIAMFGQAMFSNDSHPSRWLLSNFTTPIYLSLLIRLCALAFSLIKSSPSLELGHIVAHLRTADNNWARPFYRFRWSRGRIHRLAKFCRSVMRNRLKRRAHFSLAACTLSRLTPSTRDTLVLGNSLQKQGWIAFSASPFVIVPTGLPPSKLSTKIHTSLSTQTLISNNYVSCHYV